MRSRIQNLQSYGLHTDQVAHQTGAYLGFGVMKRLGAFVLPPGWDANPNRRLPPASNSPGPIYTSGWRKPLWEEKCLAQEHNTMFPSRAGIWNARSGDEHPINEATAPPDRMSSAKLRFTLHLNIFKSTVSTIGFSLLASPSILHDVCRHWCCCTAGCTVVMWRDISVICIFINTSVIIYGIRTVNMKHFERVYCN